MNVLPVGLEDLIHARAVESARLEFKRTWNEQTRDRVIRTIAALANDLQGLNGGYIILGIEEADGAPVLPPAGLEGLDLDRLQRDIRGHCRTIDPEYQPVLAPEVFQGKPILVIWAPAGELRPYQAPEREGGPRGYWVRLGSETVEARSEILTQLLQLTAKVPFDDRRRPDVRLSAVSGFAACRLPQGDR
jgi:ATP-dependent DNA helicase RecG